MSKHVSKPTPGKWQFFGGTGNVMAESGKVIANIQSARDIFEAYSDYGESCANARLITNASDMYDDLCEVAYFLEHVSTWERDEFAGYARIIRRTLARIDGEIED